MTNTKEKFMAGVIMAGILFMLFMECGAEEKPQFKIGKPIFIKSAVAYKILDEIEILNNGDIFLEGKKIGNSQKIAKRLRERFDKGAVKIE